MQKRLQYIEGLKGVCSTLLVGQELVRTFYKSDKPPIFTLDSSGVLSTVNNTTRLLFYSGTLSSFLFFLISGFLQIWVFSRDGWDHMHMGQYAVRRYLRLLFPMILSCGLGMLLLKTGGYLSTQFVMTNSGATWALDTSYADKASSYSWGKFFAELSLFPWKVGYAPISSALMSFVSVHVVGSFLSALIYFTAKSMKYPVLIWWVAILWLFRLSSESLEETPYSQIAAYLIGSLLCRFYLQVQHHGGLLKTSKAIRVFCVASGVFFVVFINYYFLMPEKTFTNSIFYWIFENHPHFYYLAASSSLFILLLDFEVLQSMVTNRITTFLGKSAYSTFALQNPLIWSAGTSIYQQMTQVHQMEHDKAVYIVFESILLILIPLSWVCYQVIEKPSCCFTRWILELLFTETVQAHREKEDASKEKGLERELTLTDLSQYASHLNGNADLERGSVQRPPNLACDDDDHGMNHKDSAEEKILGFYKADKGFLTYRRFLLGMVVAFILTLGIYSLMLQDTATESVPSSMETNGYSTRSLDMPLPPNMIIISDEPKDTKKQRPTLGKVKLTTKERPGQHAGTTMIKKPKEKS